MSEHSNKVELIAYMGGDNLHALAAWASTFMELGIEMPSNIENRVDVLVDYITKNSKRASTPEKLLSFLAENDHCSPFRFSSFVFTTVTDIATHIHFLKHTVAMDNENGESARYKELKEDKMYLPEDWKGIDCGNIDWYDMLKIYTDMGNALYHKALEALTPVLGKKRAKETARFFKTYNSQINSIKKFSFDGFLQIYNKRNLKSPAQQEIGWVVEEMLNQIKGIEGNPFEHSIKAFGL